MIKVSKTKDGMIFNLSNQKVSYVIQIVDNKFVTNRYFGQHCRSLQKAKI